MNTMKRILSLLLCLLALTLPACAEDARSDLQKRFGGQATFTHDGASYAPKKRISALLLAACQDDELLLSYVIVVDDDLDRIALISLPPETVVPAMSSLTLAQLYARHFPPQDAGVPQAEADSIVLLDAVNALLPEPLIESRLVLDCAGLSLLDGGGNADPALPRAEQAKQRMKVLYRDAQGLSSSEQMKLFDALSAYLATNAKTGALMKLADKAGRYDVLPTLPLPGANAALQEGAPEAAPPFIADEAALTALAIEYFYDETSW